MKWVFPLNNGGEIDGFNNSSIDTFNGRKLFSVVRETIQNSMDARLDESKPVRVSFTLSDIKSEDAVGINELLPFFESARKTAESQQKPDHPSVRFFERAAKAVKNTKLIPIFTISDFNTSGLMGDYDDSKETFKAGQWYALIKGSGLSLKSSDGALGSFGHGSKAPFAVSALRTVFYFSQIKVTGRVQERFQGKSILQSMRTQNGVMTQGTGYFSSSEKCDPLIDSAIPSWVKTVRQSTGKGTGTSILIPFPDLGLHVDDFWQEMQVSIIHNFYLAIKNKNLEIDFNGEEFLDSGNLVAQFKKLISEIELDDPENIDGTMAELECAKTIEFPTAGKVGVLVSKTFGRLSWYLRTEEDVSWRGVGIARQNGMLITEEPPRLKNFPGTKPFDLFICVEGESGSRILRSIEDPSHTRFEFDRITDLDERAEAEAAYILFTKEVRELIKEHAAMDASEEVFIDDLNDFFSGAETPSIDDGKAETSNKLTLDPIRKAKPFRPSNVGSTSGDDGADDQLPGTAPGDNRTGATGGTGATDFAGSSSSSGKKYEISLGDPRVVHIPGKPSKIFFSIEHAGPFSLSIGKVGELESQLLKYRLPGDTEWKVKRLLNSKKKGSRVSIEVELEPGAEKYALQLVAHNV
jgi:hypothetical protein